MLAPYRSRVLLAVGALLVAAAATLAVPLAFRQLIDVGFAGDGSVHIQFIALFALSVVLALGTGLRFYSVSWLGERVTADLRLAVYRQVLRQDASFFETLKPGEVLSRLTADTTLVQTLVGTSLSMGLRNVLLLAGALAMMVFTQVALALMIIALLALVVLPILYVGRRVRRLSRDSQDRVADASALAGETLSAIQVVQAFAREAWEAERFRQAADSAFGAAVRRISARAILTVMAIVMVFGAIVFVLWLGASAVIEGSMSAGQLTQFILYAAIVAGSTGALAEVMGDVQRAAGATDRLLQLLDAHPAIDSPAKATPDTAIPAPGHGRSQRFGSDAQAPVAAPPTAAKACRVEFADVRFAYPSRPLQAALESVSFEIQAGQTVALVGPSGAGKSTLFQLLLRFHDPQQGAVRLDGRDLRQLPLEALRARIGLVAQDNIVFSASVLDNIRYGRFEATDDEVLEAARAAHALEFIERLPDRWQTGLGERGVRLSGGQRQRIAIARALLRDPPLLLLDEATSALDSESERAVQAALERAMHGRTTLVIAHRLATVRHADRILVFDRGRLVQSGTHESLSALPGLYARLAAMQFDDGGGFALP